jgi:hypothetical protein
VERGVLKKVEKVVFVVEVTLISRMKKEGI